PNQETWRFGGAHFKINNLGLRAAEDWDDDIRGKVMFVGDSVTYGGNHISNEDLFSTLAVKGLPLKSGNAGIPNWGVENVYGLVVEEQFVPAATVVTTFIEDDFYRGLQQGKNKPWIKYETPALAMSELADFVWHRYFTDVQAQSRREREGVDEYLKREGRAHLILISPTRKEVLGLQPRDAKVKAALERHGVDAVYLLDKPRIVGASQEE